MSKQRKSRQAAARRRAQQRRAGQAAAARRAELLAAGHGDDVGAVLPGMLAEASRLGVRELAELTDAEINAPDDMVEFARWWIMGDEDLEFGDLTPATAMAVTLCATWAAKDPSGYRLRYQSMLDRTGHREIPGDGETHVSIVDIDRFDAVMNVLAHRVALTGYGL